MGLVSVRPSLAQLRQHGRSASIDNAKGRVAGRVARHRMRRRSATSDDSGLVSRTRLGGCGEGSGVTNVSIGITTTPFPTARSPPSSSASWMGELPSNSPVRASPARHRPRYPIFDIHITVLTSSRTVGRPAGFGGQPGTPLAVEPGASPDDPAGRFVADQQSAMRAWRASSVRPVDRWGAREPGRTSSRAMARFDFLALRPPPYFQCSSGRCGAVLNPASRRPEPPHPCTFRVLIRGRTGERASRHGTQSSGVRRPHR